LPASNCFAAEAAHVRHQLHGTARQRQIEIRRW
jgi:hypothetical protein